MNKPIISIDDIKQALEFRYATKAFDSSKKISQENIELLLEAARLAPSSYGFEPWNIIVVQEDEQLRADVKRCAGANAARFDASHILIFTAKPAKACYKKAVTSTICCTISRDKIPSRPPASRLFGDIGPKRILRYSINQQ